jgi:hypothetical protein
MIPLWGGHRLRALGADAEHSPPHMARYMYNQWGIHGCGATPLKLTRASESENGAALIPNSSNMEMDMASANVKSETIARAMQALIETSNESKFVVGWGQDQNPITYDKEVYRCGCGCGKK